MFFSAISGFRGKTFARFVLASAALVLASSAGPVLAERLNACDPARDPKR